MDIYTGPDAMLNFNRVDYVHIDLTAANPSGLAQLLAGRKTRLSTILREKACWRKGCVPPAPCAPKSMSCPPTTG